MIKIISKKEIFTIIPIKPELYLVVAKTEGVQSQKRKKTKIDSTRRPQSRRSPTFLFGIFPFWESFLILQTPSSYSSLRFSSSFCFCFFLDSPELDTWGIMAHRGSITLYRNLLKAQRIAFAHDQQALQRMNSLLDQSP